jgi:hypothetical protein
MLPRLSAGAQELIADRGYDSARFRDTLAARGIAPCIPSTRSRKQLDPHDACSTANATASRSCSAE